MDMVTYIPQDQDDKQLEESLYPPDPARRESAQWGFPALPASQEGPLGTAGLHACIFPPVTGRLRLSETDRYLSSFFLLVDCRPPGTQIYSLTQKSPRSLQVLPFLC